MTGFLKRHSSFLNIIKLSLFGYFSFWWLYKLAVLPGLHADEANLGIKAYQYQSIGISHLYGMNTYTGILQSLLDLASFRLFSLGVAQLRLGGVLFNLLGLTIVFRTLLVYRTNKMWLILLLILGQSALYILSPRVAWEVNSFTLFFMSLLLAFTFRICQDKINISGNWAAIFLITNFLDTYNHILFSCLSVSFFCGVFLWSICYRSWYYKNLLWLSGINLFNLIGLHFMMRFWADAVQQVLGLQIIPSLLLLFILEVFLFRSLKKVKPAQIESMFIKLPVPPKTIRLLIYAALIVALGFFIIYHGMAFLQVSANYKILLHFFSYRVPGWVQVLLLFTGGLYCCYFLLFLFEDFYHKDDAVLAFVVVAYLGLFCMYTINCSFRYYLAIYLLISIYMAFKMSKKALISLPLMISLCAMFCFLNFYLLAIFTHEDRPVKAVNFTIGNNQTETSAHFLSNKPLLDSLRKYKIGEINYVADRYFLEQPVLFYKLFKPWKEVPSHTAIVDYDFSSYHTGYMIDIKP